MYFICTVSLLEIYGEFLPFLEMLDYLNNSFSISSYIFINMCTVFENTLKFYTNDIIMV